MDNSPSPEHCPACEAAGPRRDPFFYAWKGQEYWIWKCGQCTHQFVYPFVDRDAQDDIYADQYFSAGGDWACGVFQGGYIEAEPSLRREARIVLDMIPIRTGYLLDIGCAGGVFLDEARSRGFTPTGIEFNESMARYGQDHFGLEIINSRLEDVPTDQWDHSFDAVTILDCLEHLSRPIDVLRKVAAWIRPGGVVLIRGPLSNSRQAQVKEWVRRLVRMPKRLPGYPLDANTFNPHSLAAMLKRSGFSAPSWIHLRRDFGNLIATREAGELR